MPEGAAATGIAQDVVLWICLKSTNDETKLPVSVLHCRELFCLDTFLDRAPSPEWLREYARSSLLASQRHLLLDTGMANLKVRFSGMNDYSVVGEVLFKQAERNFLPDRGSGDSGNAFRDLSCQ
jgi:hypothetical protein